MKRILLSLTGIGLLATGTALYAHSNMKPRINSSDSQYICIQEPGGPWICERTVLEDGTIVV
jgi:hypothetical protein